MGRWPARQSGSVGQRKLPQLLVRFDFILIKSALGCEVNRVKNLFVGVDTFFYGCVVTD